jgi:hypothetical protein
MSGVGCTLKRMAYAASPPRTPAPPIVVEAPESLGVLLGACASADKDRFSTLLECLDTAANVAADAVERDWDGVGYTVNEVIPHVQADRDPGTPRPHAHLIVAGRVVRAHLASRALMAHATYQNSLKDQLGELGYAIIPWPSPHGWELGGVTQHLGLIPRMGCGTGLYPLDSYAEPHLRIS